MADLHAKIEVQREKIDSALRELPDSTALESLSTLELAGVGALLASSYNGIENILKQVLLSRGVSVPAGAMWHRDLLNLAVEHSLISAQTRSDLAPFLAFRHFLRHAYGFDLDIELLKPLVHDSARAYRQCLTEVFSYLSK